MTSIHARRVRPNEPGAVKPDQRARVYVSAETRRLREQVGQLTAENRELRGQVAELRELIEDIDPDGELRYRSMWGVAWPPRPCPGSASGRAGAGRGPRWET